MRFKCELENRMHEFVEMWMKQMLECILMQKVLIPWRSILQDFESWKLHLNWMKLTQKKLNFRLLNAVSFFQKTSKGIGGWVSQKVAYNRYVLQISIKLKLINFSLLPFSGKLSSIQIPFQIWRRLSTLRPTPMSTYCTVLCTYATIILWNISAACTEYLHMQEGIPLQKTIFLER